jgi:hypothetical protein
MSKVALGFIPEPLTVPVANVLPSRRLAAGAVASRKFRQIKSSIEEVGMIEPLSVMETGGAGIIFALALTAKSVVCRSPSRISIC